MKEEYYITGDSKEIPKQQLQTDALHISAATKENKDTLNFKIHSICTD